MYANHFLLFFLMQKIFEIATFYFILFFGWLSFCLIFVDTYDFEKNCFLNWQGKENEANYFFFILKYGLEICRTALV